MKVRMAGRSGAAAALVLLATLTVSACTGGASTPSGVPTIFTPSPLQTATATAPAPSTTPGSGNGSTAARSPSVTAASTSAGTQAHSAPPTRRQAATSPAPVTSATPLPTQAPETGGGGTAGLQYGLLFGIGGAAILAGLGSLAYRRRLTRPR